MTSGVKFISASIALSEANSTRVGENFSGFLHLERFGEPIKNFRKLLRVGLGHPPGGLFRQESLGGLPDADRFRRRFVEVQMSGLDDAVHHPDGRLLVAGPKGLMPAFPSVPSLHA